MYSFKWFSDLRNIECSDLRNIGAELFDTKKIPRTPLTPEHKNQVNLINVSYVKKNLVMIKKVNTTKILEKFRIMIIILVYTEMQHILNVI